MVDAIVCLVLVVFRWCVCSWLSGTVSSSQPTAFVVAAIVAAAAVRIVPISKLFLATIDNEHIAITNSKNDQQNV